MIELQNALNYAKDNISKAVEITQYSSNKPVNVNLFNHTIPEASKESLMIDNIFWFPNIKSLYGAIITNPKSQYIFCNEVYDCVAIGGTIIDKNQRTHIFGAHVYECMLMFQMQTIIDEILKYGLIPKKALYSPREDTLSWEKGQKTLERHFSETTTILRDKENRAEMIIGIEGIILNDKFYNY